MSLKFVPFDYIRASFNRIRPHIVRTPLIRNDDLENAVKEAVGSDVKLYFKAEVLQKTGSFKVRGALNAVLTAKDAGSSGVVTFSSGNHGAATAFAAERLGMKAAVVVPKSTDSAKIANISQYGAEIVKTEQSIDAMTKACDDIVARRSYSKIAPYNQKEVIGGHASCAVEILDEFPEMDALLAPISGGGLLAGLAVGAKHLKPKIKVFGVAPTVKELGTALATQQTLDHWLPSAMLQTKCDGLRAHPGSITWPIICELLEKQAFDVTDVEASAAMRIAWQRLKLTVELSSATVLAAVLSKEFAAVVREQKLRHICLILSGGNVDLNSPFHWT